MDMSKEKLTLGSLFSGSGGFELAGILAGIEPIWNSEVEPFAIRVTTKRLPFVKHYGDVSTLSGDKLEPVNIITFGSPCQDMSVAGKRDGLYGERSGLFHEAIRIVREMREATDGKYPRYIVWENVPGAFSSNQGEDFRAVLSAVCSAARGETTDIPGLKKWEKYGEIVGEGYSVAWRVLDAQFWGVPQRRARIFLVADFGSECAGDILFIPESLCWNLETGKGTWEGTAETSERGFDETGELCLMDQGGSVMDLSYGKTGMLRAEAHGHLPIVMSAGFCTEHSAKSRSIGYEEEKSPILRAGVKPAVMAVENHGADGRCRLTKDNIVPTLTQRMGTGGNNVPLVLQAYGIGGYNSEGMLSPNPYAGIYEAEKSRTLDLNGGNPNCHQGGIAVVEKVYPLEGNGQRPSHFGDGWNESDVMYTLNATEKHGVAYTASKNDFMVRVSEDVAGTLVASDYKDPPIVCSDPYYVVRRLTPKECAKLQGFPDDWCSNLETPDPSEDEICYWMDIFETHRKAITKAKKAKTEKYVRKWLQNPYSESAEYRLWGNGVALPCVHYVMSAIKRQYEREYD